MMAVNSFLPVLCENSIANYLSLLVIGLVTYIAIFYFHYFTRPNQLPGPIPLPIIGNVLQYPGDAGVWMKQLRQTYGDIFELYVGSARVVCLCRGNLVGKLMNSSPLRLPLPNDGLGEFGMSTKGVLINSDYETWSYNRKFLHKTISTPNCVREAVESTQVLFREMEGLWKRLDNDKGIDLAKWITRFTFENVIFLTTTLRVHAITNYYNVTNPQNKVTEPEGTLTNSEDYIKSITELFDGLVFFLLTPKILRNSPGIRGTKEYLLNNKAWLCSQLLGVIKARREQIESSKEKIGTRDLLTQLLTINTDKDVTQHIADDKHTEIMSDDDVRSVMMDPVGGGTITVANTICYIIYYLAHNPQVKERMVQELDNVLGNDRDSHITFDQVNKLEYTEAVFKEVTRIFPAMPVNLRTNAKPEEIAGHTFPANTQFLIGVEEIQNSSDWVDPDTFNPDRWYGTKQPKDSLFPFGAGARICPGKNLGLAEVKTLMALLFRKYDVELVDKASPVKYTYRFIKVCDELKVKIKPRN